MLHTRTSLRAKLLLCILIAQVPTEFSHFKGVKCTVILHMWTISSDCTMGHMLVHACETLTLFVKQNYLVLWTYYSLPSDLIIKISSLTLTTTPPTSPPATTEATSHQISTESTSLASTTMPPASPPAKKYHTCSAGPVPPLSKRICKGNRLFWLQTHVQYNQQYAWLRESLTYSYA